MQTQNLAARAAIVVAAPPAVVYDFFTDITRHPEVSPECVRCEWSDTAGARVGAVFVGHNRIGEYEWSRVCEIVTADAPHRFAFDVGTEDHKYTRWTYSFDDDGSGGTVLTEAFELLDLPPRLAEGTDEQRRVRVAELEDGIRQTLHRAKAVLDRPFTRLVVRDSEGTSLRFGDAEIIVKARSCDSGFSVAELVLPPGGTAPLHMHEVDDTFYVLAGEVALWCGGRTTHAKAGDYVRLPAGIPHSIHVEGERPLRALLIEADDDFIEFASELDQLEPFDPALASAAAERHHQTVLGPSPFASVAQP